MSILASRDNIPPGFTPPPPIAGSGGMKSGDPLFDRWLAHYLGRLYDPVVREPVPEDMRKIEDMLKVLDDD